MIYLDNAATTACAPEVLEAMLPFFRDSFANASSVDHLPGTIAKRSIDEAREAVAALVGARPEDVIFTSGSTEANNLALTVCLPVATTPVEHPSILGPFGRRTTDGSALLAIDDIGRIRIPELRTLVTSFANGAILVSAIATNNETGVEQHLPLLRDACDGTKTLLHLDATQAILTTVLNLKGGSADALSLSAHKFHGPKGVGALVATSRLRRLLTPIVHGGGHEGGLRAGTLNVPGIVGFGAAAKLLIGRAHDNRSIFDHLSKTFLKRLKEVCSVPVSATIQDQCVSPHILSLRFTGINGRALLNTAGDRVAFSLGSACATGKAEPSHVLVALGHAKSTIAETVRFSFSRYDTPSAIFEAATAIGNAATSLASLNLSNV